METTYCLSIDVFASEREQKKNRSIRWLQIYPRLETAGFLAVGFVGLKLLAMMAMPTLHPSELVTLAAVVCLMVWGFSVRESSAAEES